MANILQTGIETELVGHAVSKSVNSEKNNEPHFLKDLPEKADTFPLLTGKFSGLRKVRIGDYRVIYTIFENTALVLRVSHRRDACR